MAEARVGRSDAPTRRRFVCASMFSVRVIQQRSGEEKSEGQRRRLAATIGASYAP